MCSFIEFNARNSAFSKVNLSSGWSTCVKLMIYKMGAWGRWWCECPLAINKIVALSLDHICFVCLWFIVPLENFSLIWRRHHYRWRAANFDLCLAFMAVEQWGFFSVPHLLWHGASVYNGHLRGPVTLTSLAERLAGNCHYLFWQLRSVAAEIWTPNLPSAPPRRSVGS